MNTMRIYRIIGGFSALTLCVILLANPSAAVAGFSAGLELCVKSILPALFPFFILSGIIMRSHLYRFVSKPLAPLTKLCGIRSVAAPGLLMLSWLGGYAVCASLLRDEVSNETISSKEVSMLLLLGCCSSPGFVIGCIGGQMLGSVRLGVLLYFFQLSASIFTTALFLPFSSQLTSPKVSTVPLSNHNTSILDSAIHSSLSVCGCVLFFRVVVSVIDDTLSLPPLYSALFSGLLEISSGCFAFSQLGTGVALYGICTLLSLLSLSVFAQLASILHTPSLMLVLAASRLMHLIVFLGEVRLSLAALPLNSRTEVFSTLDPRVVTSSRIAPDAIFCVFLFFCCMLYNFSYKFYNRKKDGGVADVQKDNLRK